MNQQSTSKYRKTHLRLSKIARWLSFNFLYLPFFKRLALIGEIMILSTLFFNFVAIGDGVTFWAFSRFFFLGSSIILISWICLVVVILSNISREHLRTLLGLPLSDVTLIVIVGMLQFSILLCDAQYLFALSYFTKEIIYYDAPIYAIVGAIVVGISGYLGFLEEKKRILTTLYVENNQTTTAQFEEYRDLLSKDAWKKNMTLPI